MSSRYEIRIQEALDEKWQTHFAPLELRYAGDETILVGEVQDQAELFGILLKIRDLGAHLAAVNTVESG